MKVAFTAGTRVSFTTPNGTRAKGFISDYKKSWDWNVPGYLGEGYYAVDVFVRNNKVGLTFHEDDLQLAPVTLDSVLDYLYIQWQLGARQDDNLYDAIQKIEQLNRVTKAMGQGV